MSIREQCATCKWWTDSDGQGMRQCGDGYWRVGYTDDYGSCDQLGDETRGDQWCQAFEMHKGLDMRNGTGYY